MKKQLYILEARNDEGKLDFKVPQPEEVFGMKSITGITDDEIADVIFYFYGEDAVLDGMNFYGWAAILHPSWIIRKKYW